QILRLKCKETGQEFIFTNKHLLFNQAQGDIKIGRLAMLIAYIDEKLTKSRRPVIISDDLNIEPLSYVYTYINDSSCRCEAALRITGQGLCGGPYVEAENILPLIANIGRDSMFISKEANRQAVSADHFTHPLRLTSVYHHFTTNGEKEVSKYHKEVANPDFIFYSVKKKMKIYS
ncbi:hypothetical protein KIN20_035458, partial [Parelaphostrongylus tenuis]